MRARALLWFLLIAAMFLASACSLDIDEGDGSGGGESVDAAALGQLFLSSTFTGVYDAKMPDGEGAPQSIELSLTKSGTKMRIEMRLLDFEDQRLFAVLDVATGEDTIACRALTQADGEIVCVVDEDEAWTLAFAPLLPVVALLSSLDEDDPVPDASRLDDQTIAEVLAGCFEVSGDGEPVETCLGSRGEVLSQSTEYLGEQAEFTAREVRYDVATTDVLIPYPIVEEGEVEATPTPALR